MTSDDRVQCPRVGLEVKCRTHQSGVYMPLRALFLVYEVEGLFYLCSENKGADQLRGYCTADLCLRFRIYTKTRFSHDMAHLSSLKWFKCNQNT